MFINPINKITNIEPNIRDDEFVLGFDDSISRQKRNHIREHYSTYSMPYQSIYDNERKLDDFYFSSLIKNLTRQNKVVNSEKLKGLKIYNFESIGNNSYRGATLVNHPDYLNKLKEAGIKRIIDLSGSKEYEEVVKNIGLEYFSFDMKEPLPDCYCIWDCKAFMDKDAELKRYYGYFSRENIEKNKNFFDTVKKEFDDECKVFIDRLIHFINFLSEGFCYIGCEYGTSDTDDALVLNYLFNPNKNNYEPKYFISKRAENIKNLHSKLLDKDKTFMGWTKNFDEIFSNRLKTLIKNFP